MSTSAKFAARVRSLFAWKASTCNPYVTLRSQSAPLTCRGPALQPEMVGHYLGEFSITYKPVRHGRAGLGSTTGSRFIPLH